MIEGGGAQHRAALARIARRFIGALHQLLYALAAQGGDLHHRHAERLLQLFRVQPVAVLFDGVHHVQGDDDGDVYLHDLRREIEVAFEVGRVDDVDDAVRLFVDDVVAGDDLFRRIGREGIDAGQVYDLDLFGQLFIDALPLVDGDARPVADVRRAARKGVEQRRLAAVRVARKREFKHSSPP